MSQKRPAAGEKRAGRILSCEFCKEKAKKDYRKVAKVTVYVKIFILRKQLVKITTVGNKLTRNK